MSETLIDQPMDDTDFLYEEFLKTEEQKPFVKKSPEVISYAKRGYTPSDINYLNNPNF